ncbi:MAG: glycosyltransferase family 2 protein [cyanobacterium endosymbiont of Rhopalodia musculus]|uniref:glycosyltransferase family 2 protein n=1 Tax=cyanobacterium endosymbiont of Epithemia clementina EcSB TaxID=3034674 RepID=UPI0024816415|nr:glycosyltransferase family 2 protein [cyanobacterium endosymbiont of Epithemia clementina EcSB]WGT68165.1 glycosyltransferase family 2 protein [cyanobacterium endosymbiont of Epithemia clementina EcSB]
MLDTNKIKFSVITVCKNADRFIEKAIQSVINQSYQDLEYIIIDGKSQDCTVKIIEKYLDRITKFVSETDSGIYSAMNKGIRYSTGNFICFLNADDYFVDDGVITDLANYIKQNPSSDFIYGDLEVRYPSGRLIRVNPPTPENVLDELVCGCLPHQASFAKADLFFSTIGFFNENYKISSDYEWFLKLTQNETVKLSYYPRLISSYYSGGLSSQIKISVAESYHIQNQHPLYQTPYWMKRRILKYQEFVINLRKCLADTEESRDYIEQQYLGLEKRYKNLKQDNQQLQEKLNFLKR